MNIYEKFKVTFDPPKISLNDLRIHVRVSKVISSLKGWEYHKMLEATLSHKSESTSGSLAIPWKHLAHTRRSLGIS